MGRVLGATLLTVLWTLASQPPGSPPPLSLDRVRDGLAQPPALRVRTDMPLEVKPTFTSRVDQRVFVPTLDEVLHKQFDLNILQRQSAEWASKCCGLNLGQAADLLSDAWRDRKRRKTREQIARELAELEAARPKAPPPVVK